MTEFKIGQRVHVEFDGVITGDPIGIRGHTVSVQRESGFIHSVRPEDVTPLEPDNWPPQEGDIWEVDGSELFAVIYPRYGGMVALVRDSSGFMISPEEMKDSGSPVLVRRRGE